MGLLHSVAKTAVVAGTATASRNAVNRRSAKKQYGYLLLNMHSRNYRAWNWRMVLKNYLTAFRLSCRKFVLIDPGSFMVKPVPRSRRLPNNNLLVATASTIECPPSGSSAGPLRLSIIVVIKTGLIVTT